MKKPLPVSFENTQYAFAYKSDLELKRSYRLFSLMHYSWLVKIGSLLAPIALKFKLPVKGIIRDTIFKQFCGGERLEEVAQTATSLHRFSVACVLDYGVEGAQREEDFDTAVREFQKAINYAGSHPDIPMVVIKVTGLARFQLLQKYQEGSPLTAAEEREWQRVFERINAICRTACEQNVSVLIDAEESWIQKGLDTLSCQMMARYNQANVVVYNTFQLYQHSRFAALREQWRHSRDNNYLMGAKLVRGAYMEKERKRALEKGYPSPIHADKAATDKDYDDAVQWCLERLDTIALFIGTHNEKSCMRAAAYLHEHQLPYDHPHVHFSQLYGMSDNITFNLAKAGYRASKYLPYGPVEDILPYLIRRSRENSSISGQMGRELRLLHKEISRRKHLK